LLEADANGLSHLEPFDEELHGLNADQILLTEAFGLPSSRAPDFAARFDEAVRELDPDDWKDSLRLMRMFNRGSAGADSSLELPPPPAWASKAASELATLLGADMPATDPVPAKQERLVAEESASNYAAKKKAVRKQPARKQPVRKKKPSR
jgi:hypothetical protein